MILKEIRANGYWIVSGTVGVQSEVVSGDLLSAGKCSLQLWSRRWQICQRIPQIAFHP